MVRPLLVRAVSGAVAALVGVPVCLTTTATAGQATVASAAYDAPLVITIESLTPGEVPDQGPVVVSGTISNRDVVTWGAISLYPFINAGDCSGCPPPITDTTTLAEAAETDPEALVGNRITAVSDTVRELGPGEVAEYTITVPRRLLGVTEAGVYWFGVHASGASEASPRDTLADGRARTFLPYVPRGRGSGYRGAIDTAVVVPLRHRITHTTGGAIARPDDWRAAFGEYGDLGGPLDFGAAAGPRPITWLVDPAVPDAVRRLVRGNQPRNLGPKGGEDDGETDRGDPEQEAVDATQQGADSDATPPDPTAVAAEDWLASLELQLRGEDVLTLPYGDLDVSAAAGAVPDLYPLARERMGDVLAEWETETSPVVASPGGYLDPSAFDIIDDESLWLLTDRMFADEEAFPDGPPRVGSYEQHPVAVTSYGAASGGPGPDPRLAPVAFRQRVLSEAALRLMSPGQRRPLVVMVPRDVSGDGAEQFWSGLSVDWVNLTTVSAAIDRQRQPIDPETLRYPPDQAAAELDSSVFFEVADLVQAGATLQNLLTEGEGIAAEVRDEALAGASYNFRGSPRISARNLTRSRGWIERRLGAVRIDAPPGVTLSSADGSFAATVTNRLDRTVTVRIAGSSLTDGVTIDGGEPIVLAAKSRTTVFLDAHTSGPGVHNVTLAVTDVDGTPLGSSDQVPIRSGQVSEVIWVIIGVGAGILFLAIVLRLYRRIRGGRGEAVQGTT